MNQYETVLHHIFNDFKTFENSGKKATYIPELAHVDENLFGVSLTCLNGTQISLGDAHQPFSIQSISKVFSLVLAYNILGEDLWKRVDVEPSGDTFNSLILLELELGIPRNPFINAGAIVLADILISHLQNPKEDFLKFIHQLTNDHSIQYDLKVFNSEKSVAYRNYSLINLMKSFGNIHNDIDTVMDFYFRMCSVNITCEQLSKAVLFFANDGVHPISKEQILTPKGNRRINAIMQLCGFYDEAGEFAYRVGLPGKSGVGGGIMAIHPGLYSVVVFSPKLNKKGNSTKGMAFLERLTSELNNSIF
ncbi:glutaminase [Wenyingzhuangia aestuarii]|uniref:glutaminase n=1 Tax=Wenyingzhuangia aestuarii TaxID=1647582 RepID=UPI00143AA001|nr:glutaminase [Wenyingzhuangia aestuarii]NJB82662.1 glutaminase [Wenyingzhuangia aestuarii]